MDVIRAYHGTHGFTTPLGVRPTSRERAEHGPGIYLTTGYDTAARYARGSGYLMLPHRRLTQPRLDLCRRDSR